MRFIRTTSLFLSCLLCFINTVTAEKELDLSEPSLSPIQQSQADILELELEFLEISTKDKANLFRKITATEELVRLYCAPNLIESLDLPPLAVGGKCDKLLEDLSVIDKNNPSLLCVRNGIFSKICFKAFQHRWISPLSVFISVDKLSQIASKAKMQAMKTENEFRELKENFRVNLSGYQSSKDPEEREKLKNSVLENSRKIIQNSCLYSGPTVADYKNRSMSQAGKFYGEIQETTESDDDFRKFITNFIEETEKNSSKEETRLTVPGRSSHRQKPEGFSISMDRNQPEFKHEVSNPENKIEVRTEEIIHIHYVADHCLKHCQEVISLFPNNVYAICGLEGHFAPRCIKALKMEKEKVKSEHSRKIKIAEPEDGLSSF